MFVGTRRVSECSSNCSAATALSWEDVDFDLCNGSETGLYIWAFCTVVFFVVGFPASIAILWGLYKSHRRGARLTPNTFFILNTSVMDATFFCFVPPGIINYFFWRSAKFEAMVNCIYALNMWGRPLLMACVCLDGYLAVVHPVIYRKHRSLIPRMAMAGVVWASTAAAGVSYACFYSLFYTMFTIIPYVVAMGIIAICDSCIVYALVTSAHGRKHIHPQKQRALQTLINSLVTAIVSYIPPVLLLGVGIGLINDRTTYICSVCIYVNTTTTLGSAVMPILYLSNLGKFRSFMCGCKYP